MDKNINKFTKTFFLFALPAFTVVISYFILDPFKVLYDYDNYYVQGKGGISLTKDYVSTHFYQKYNPTENFNSFILGNSRSFAFYLDDWNKHLDKTAKCYHYSAFGESLYGLVKKISYINKHSKIKNILIIWDSSLLELSEPEYTRPLHMVTPVIDNGNKLLWHKCYFLSFLNPHYFSSYYVYALTGHIYPFMEGVVSSYPVDYNNLTGEYKYTYLENEIANNTFYTPSKISIFYDRDSLIHYNSTVIGERQVKLLKEMQEILIKNSINYKIVISPMYDAKKISKQDLQILKNIFGNSSIYDFSGYNDITKDYKNYYETAHFRVSVAQKIMKKIYSIN